MYFNPEMSFKWQIIGVWKLSARDQQREKLKNRGEKTEENEKAFSLFHGRLSRVKKAMNRRALPSDFGRNMFHYRVMIQSKIGPLVVNLDTSSMHFFNSLVFGFA